MNKTVKNIVTALVLLLAVVMLLSLAACGKEEAPAATQAPAAPAATEAPAAQTAAPTEEPAAQPSAQPEAEEGVFVSASKGFRFEYDPNYIAVANPADNAMIYPTGDVELPFCSVSLISGSSAVDYLKEMSAAAQEELGDAIKSQPGEPADAGVEAGRSTSSASPMTALRRRAPWCAATTPRTCPAATSWSTTPLPWRETPLWLTAS